MLSPVTTVDIAVGALIGCWKENNVHILIKSNVISLFKYMWHTGY